MRSLKKFAITLENECVWNIFAYFPCITNSKLLLASHTKIGNESFLMVTKVLCISEAAKPLEMRKAVQRYNFLLQNEVLSIILPSSANGLLI